MDKLFQDDTISFSIDLSAIQITMKRIAEREKDMERERNSRMRALQRSNAKKIPGTGTRDLVLRYVRRQNMI